MQIHHTSCTIEIFIKYLTLISKDWVLVSILFPFLWKFLSIFGTLLQDPRFQHIFLLMASWNPTRWIDLLDGRAEQHHLDVLRTCWVARWHTINRALWWWTVPKTFPAVEAPRWGLNDTGLTVTQDQWCWICYFSKFVHFLSFLVWSWTDWCKSMHAITC